MPSALERDNARLHMSAASPSQSVTDLGSGGGSGTLGQDLHV